MKKLILLISVVCIFSSLLVGCKSKEDIKIDIEIGTPREEVLELLGEPQGTLFGFYGDIYIIDNSEIIVYTDNDYKYAYFIDDVSESSASKFMAKHSNRQSGCFGG
ncbi:hypothetical protein [Sedimentibacter sp.]|uniref:hypothetical protein n=1 Tax=Sedimentibacter sp. TaxID=1960295 RepID=UPI0028AA8548|nr:hypothetical protein [Sedimentibacter sp.]